MRAADKFATHLRTKGDQVVIFSNNDQKTLKYYLQLVYNVV